MRLRWLFPALLLALPLFLATPAGRPLAPAWLGHAWPALSFMWQWLQQLSPVPLALVFVPLVLLSLAGDRSRMLFRLALTAGLLLTWLQLGWGLNYQREPVGGQLGLAAASDQSQQRLLAAYLLEVINDTQDADADTSAALESGREALNGLLDGLGYPVPVTAEVVTLPAGSLLTFGVSGMLFPFTLEPFTDAGLAGWQQVSTAVHELGHVAGVAREDDATLLAAIAGLRAGHPFTRYSAALDAFSRLALPPEEMSALNGQLPERARADLEAGRRAGLDHRSEWLAGTQAALLDWWLRRQGSGGGVADYSLGASRLALALEAGLLP